MQTYHNFSKHIVLDQNERSSPAATPCVEGAIAALASLLGLRPARETDSDKSQHAKMNENTMTWRKQPVIYEIPTWVWLEELRLRCGQALTLATIPAQEWDALADLCPCAPRPAS